MSLRSADPQPTVADIKEDTMLPSVHHLSQGLIMTQLCYQIQHLELKEVLAQRSPSPTPQQNLDSHFGKIWGVGVTWYCET